MHRRPVVVVGLLLAQACTHRPEPVPEPRMDRILARPDGSCVVTYAADCPATGPCEPGADAEQVPCPESLKGPDASQRAGLHVYRQGDGCWVSFPDDCPPGTRCNPPPPEPTVCPSRLAPPQSADTIVRDGDQCLLVSTVDCPPDVLCNPPPPRPVPCP